MKTLQGTVVSNKATQSAVVAVEYMWQHPLYKKTVKRTKRFFVHAPMPVLEGSVVEITPCRPMSRRKHFVVSRIVSTPELKV